MPPADTIVEEGSFEWPYVLPADHGGPPMPFRGSVGVVGPTSADLFSVDDRSAGRYEASDLPSVDE